jgi:hypothetical protein
MKIRIVLPTLHHTGVSPETHDSISRLMAEKKHEYDFRQVTTAWCSKARNAGINEERSCLLRQNLGPIDAFLHIDADNSFEPGQIYKLIEHDKPIIGAAYLRRGSDEIVAGSWDRTDKPVQFLPLSTKGLQEVDWVGHGVCLVKREVYENMDFPWYRFDVIRSADKAFEVGEDISFCMAAQKAGFGIFVDCDTIVKHHTDWAGRGDNRPQSLYTAIRKIQMQITSSPRITSSDTMNRRRNPLPDAYRFTLAISGSFIRS